MDLKLKAKIVERFGTQADFSQAVAEDESFISRVIRGRRTLSQDRCRIWAEALGCCEEELFTQTNKTSEVSNAD